MKGVFSNLFPHYNIQLLQENANIFVVDWTGGSGVQYRQAVQNTRIVGHEVAYFIQFLHNETTIPYSRIHLMGTSLGAQVSGFVGEILEGIGRISGKILAETRTTQALTTRLTL